MLCFIKYHLYFSCMWDIYASITSCPFRDIFPVSVGEFVRCRNVVLSIRVEQAQTRKITESFCQSFQFPLYINLPKWRYWICTVCIALTLHLKFEGGRTESPERAKSGSILTPKKLFLHFQGVGQFLLQKLWVDSVYGDLSFDEMSR